MKYKSITKTDRNNEIKKVREDQPELSLREIGARFGISGQAVWVILKKNFPWRK